MPLCRLFRPSSSDFAARRRNCRGGSVRVSPPRLLSGSQHTHRLASEVRVLYGQPTTTHCTLTQVGCKGSAVTRYCSLQRKAGTNGSSEGIAIAPMLVSRALFQGSAASGPCVRRRRLIFPLNRMYCAPSYFFVVTFAIQGSIDSTPLALLLRCKV